MRDGWFHCETTFECSDASAVAWSYGGCQILCPGLRCNYCICGYCRALEAISISIVPSDEFNFRIGSLDSGGSLVRSQLDRNRLPWLAGHWHKSFDGHFQTLLKDNVSKELDTVAKASDPVCVCEYRYYGMIGSYRQHSITRPLFTRERDGFISMLEQGKFEFVIVLKSDEHWLREYENCLEWLRGSPDRFEQIAESGDKVIFRRIRNVRVYEDDRS